MLKLNIEEIKDGPAGKIDILPLGGSKGKSKDSSVPASASDKSIDVGPGMDLLINSSKVGKSPGKDKSKNTSSINDDINSGFLGGFGKKISKGLGLGDIGGSAKVSFDNEPTIIKDSVPLTGKAFPETIKFSDLGKATDIASNKDTIKIGSATAQEVDRMKKSDKKWDDLKKFNDVPVDQNVGEPVKETLSPEQELREKFKYLRKLEALERKGHMLTKKYDMRCGLEEMKGEYEMIKHDLEKKNSAKFQGKMLMAFVSGIEFLNNKFDPLDVKLDGWGESVSENIDEYDDIFGELHEKYGSKAKMAPELKLLFMLGGSAAMVHMTNTMFKTSMPGMDDIMKQNPELMHQFTQAAVNTMSQDNPGMGKFMSGVMNQGTTRQGNPRQGSTSIRDPMREASSMRQRPATHGRGGADDIPMPRYEERRERKEMKGPSDISDLLSGLKTKTINIKADNKSTMSMEDLDERNKDMTKKSKKKSRGKSKNIFSLDLN